MEVITPETATTSSATSGALTTAGSLASKAHGRRCEGCPIVYVTSQGLFYDSIVTADPLPPRGPFQELRMAGPSGLQTEFGPGDPGYVGGRWKLVNGDGKVVKYFSCPLLGPGRPTLTP
jgi:hypothetical protein